MCVPERGRVQILGMGASDEEQMLKRARKRRRAPAVSQGHGQRGRGVFAELRQGLRVRGSLRVGARSGSRAAPFSQRGG